MGLPRLATMNTDRNANERLTVSSSKWIIRLRMKDDRRSTAEKVFLWWRPEEEEEEKAVGEDETGWRCWKHSWQPFNGVCAACLRDRLLRLCPDCGTVRPCGCFPSPSSSASSSSGELEDSAAIGAVGPVSQLIESEPAFRRSRSVGFELLRSKSTTAPAAGCGSAPPSRPRDGGKRWALIWPFLRAGAGRKDPLSAGMFRSKSVAAGRSSAARGGAVKEATLKGLRRWHFPSPMKVFWHRKPATKVVAQD